MSLKSQQIILLAQSFIKKELSSEKVRQYQKLRRKLQIQTPSKSPNSTSHFLSSNKKTHHSRTLLQTNTQRKPTKSITKKTLQPYQQSKKGINSFLQSIVLDLNSIRQKVLRKQYSRKTMKQINWRTKECSSADETVVGELKLALERIVLALDVQTLKLKEQISKNKLGGQGQLARVHKDNKWLIQQVESLVEENDRLKSQGAGFIKHKR